MNVAPISWKRSGVRSAISAPASVNGGKKLASNGYGGSSKMLCYLLGTVLTESFSRQLPT